MTAPSIISHQRAKEIAGDWTASVSVERDDSFQVFVASGEITPAFGDGLRHLRRGFPTPTLDELREIDALLAYVAHHGERGAVEAGYRVTVTSPCEACGQELEWVDGENPHWRGHGDSEDAPGWEPGPDPYCVREDEPDGGAPPISCQEVATLSDLRRIVVGRRSAAYADGVSRSEWVPVFRALAEMGTAGEVPLPDGSSITVEKTEGWAAC